MSSKASAPALAPVQAQDKMMKSEKMSEKTVMVGGSPMYLALERQLPFLTEVDASMSMDRNGMGGGMNVVDTVLMPS